MKKRLLALLMCILLALSSFVMSACSESGGGLETLAGDGETKTASSNSPMTISIYSIRGEGTTDEAIELVEKALSTIAIRRYNTTIDLVLIDEEDYASQIFAKVRMSVNSYNTKRLGEKNLTLDDKNKIMASNVDYYYDLAGQSISYNIKQSTNLPSELLNGELDIFLVYTPVGGNSSLYKDGTPESEQKYSMFDILYNEQAICELKSYLDGDFAGVKAVAYDHALKYVTKAPYDSKGTTYDYFGVPNNYIYGGYDYVVFNTGYVNDVMCGLQDKQVYADGYVAYSAYVDKYNAYLNDYATYLAGYKTSNPDDKLPKAPTAPYVVVDAHGDRYLALKAEYEAIIAEKDPSVTDVYAIGYPTNLPAAPTGAFAELVKELAALKGQPGYDYDRVVYEFGKEPLPAGIKREECVDAYSEYVTVSNSDDAVKFAVGAIYDANLADKQLFEQHTFFEVYASASHTITNETEYCDSMFCIGRPAEDNKGARAKRCLEILDLLNNNTEFRNIFQYGVEGVHYTQYSEKEDVNPISTPKLETHYYMEGKYTGNMFILYPSSKMTPSEKLMAKDKWQLAKDQNIELVPKHDSE